MQSLALRSVWSFGPGAAMAYYIIVGHGAARGTTRDHLTNISPQNRILVKYGNNMGSHIVVSYWRQINMLEAAIGGINDKYRFPRHTGYNTRHKYTLINSS